MAKRSNKTRRKNDYYKTPIQGLKPLLRILPIDKPFTFVEPCAGDNRIVDYLEHNTTGVCIGSYDINPQHSSVVYKDTSKKFKLEKEPDLIITNPPWTRDILHSMILNFTAISDTLLLFDSDWMHNVSSQEYLKRCSDIYSIGRLKWIEGTPYSSKDNCCWYYFPKYAKIQYCLNGIIPNMHGRNY